jgi:hypothetical protein
LFYVGNNIKNRGFQWAPLEKTKYIF